MIRATAQTPGFVKRLMVWEGHIIEQGERIANIEPVERDQHGQYRRAARSVALPPKPRPSRPGARPRWQSSLPSKPRRNGGSKDWLASSPKQRRRSSFRRSGCGWRSELVTRAEDIAARGFMARKDLEARLSAALAAEQELASTAARSRPSSASLPTSRRRLASIPHRDRRGPGRAPSGGRPRSSSARPTPKPRRSQFVTAPIAGRVAALPVTAGQSVAAGATIAVIMPAGGRLEAELLAPSRADRLHAPGPGGAAHAAGLPLPALRHRARARCARSPARCSARPRSSIQGLNIQEPVFRIRVAPVARSDAGLRREPFRCSPACWCRPTSCSTAAA